MNELTTIDATFNVQRVTKAGKVQQRGALGVLTSGNRDEKAALSVNVMNRLISNNTYGPVMAEVLRVFPVNTLKAAKPKKGETAKSKAGDVVEINGMLYVYTGERQRPFVEFNTADTSAATTEALCRAVVAKMEGREAKGEKAVYLQAARAVLSHMAAKREAKEAALAA